MHGPICLLGKHTGDGWHAVYGFEKLEVGTVKT